MTIKENENRDKHRKIRKAKKTAKKNQKAQKAIDALPQPDPTLPPFSKRENEPFVNENIEDDALIEKLNSFADNNYKINESVLKKISWTNFFGTKESQNVPEIDESDEEEDKEAENNVADNKD